MAETSGASYMGTSKKSPKIIMLASQAPIDQSISPQPMSAKTSQHMFVAWVPFQRRQMSMAPLLGFEPVFLPVRQTLRILRPVQYLAHARKTLLLLKAKAPKVIWVQLPQVPLLTVALHYKRRVDPSVRVIADCHNRILNPPWNIWPGLVAQLNRCDTVVVHNDAVIPKVSAMGVRQEIIRLLEDPPARIKSGVSATLSFPRPWMLFLASFNPDEPVQELFEAARLAPDIHFVLAGDADRAHGRHSVADHPEKRRLARVSEWPGSRFGGRLRRRGARVDKT